MRPSNRTANILRMAMQNQGELPNNSMNHGGTDNQLSSCPASIQIQDHSANPRTDSVQQEELSFGSTTDSTLETELSINPSTGSVNDLEGYLENPCSIEIPNEEAGELINEQPNHGYSSPTETDGHNVYAASCSSEYPTRVRLRKLKSKNLCTSPINSDDVTEFDDNSEEDPNYTDSSSSESISDIESVVQAEVEIEKKKKGKKRESNPENWEVKKTKILRNSGKAYVSSSKSKKQFQARRMRSPCGENCRLRCKEKINIAARQEIFDNYWSISALQRQREYIVAHTNPIKPKYRYSTTRDFRSLNSAFYFEVNKTRIRVCKKFFKATLDINDPPIRTALSKKTETGFVEGDKRGKHDKHPTVDPEIKDSVRNFINSIPRIESHYLRAQTTREYIESDKSLADLHRDYKASREMQHLPFANSVMFNRIFNGEFNISFYVPKIDQCDLCESFKNADEHGKETLLESYNQHQEEKELSRKEKEADKEKPNVAVYDLQAVMPLPKGLVSSFYYKSIINCYNFTEEWGTNFNVGTDKKKLKWHDIKVLKVEKDNPGIFYFKTSYKDLEYKKVNVQNMKIRSSKTWESVRLVKAYTKRFPLPDNKKRDIQDLIDKNIIPNNYYNSYYKDVLNLC